MVDADHDRSEPAGSTLDDAELFRALLEATTNAAVLFRPDGNIVSINRVGLDMLGLSAPTPTWSSLWPDALRADADRAASEAIAGRRTRFRSLIPSSEGAPRWVDTTISPAMIAGQVAGMLATSRDVTAEIETQSFLDNVVEYVPAALFARDAADGRYVMLNLAAEDMFGLPREQILGRTDAQLFPADRVAVLKARDAEVIASGRVSEFDEPYETRDETRFFRTRLMATFGDEGPRHLIGVSEDVSESRRATEALRAAADRADAANRSKSEFLANMSHEIRTPLNGVVGVADVLARTALTDGQRDMVEIIRSSGETLERLLSDVLDLARIESGRVEIESEPFNLADAARAVTGLLSMRAQEKGVALTLSLDPAAETRVVGDVVRLKQILTNLLSNAVKFTARGEVRLTVQAVPGDHPRFRFAVRDTGVGFDASQKDRVFTRFQQADGSITRRFGGTGLGLAISRQLTELMGGELDCHSTPGEGSTFTVELPVILADHEGGGRGETPGLAAAASVQHDGRTLRVLLADDHPINRKVVELILGQVGIDLVSVEDGAAAVEAFRSGGFDAVLMDMQMPVMDGLTATRAIRELERAQNLDRTPIFMLTANALAEHLEASRVSGADQHLTKPITADKLLGALIGVEPRARREAA